MLYDLMVCDQTSADMIRVLVLNKSRFNQDYQYPALKIRKHFIMGITKTASGRQAIELIEQYLEKVESSMESIISQRSSYFWLFLLRRILPVSADGHDFWSTLLARTIAEHAILKHANSVGPDLEHEFRVEASQLVMRNAGYSDYTAAYQIEYLAFEFWHLTAVARSVWKGASLVTNGNHFTTIANDDLAFLIDSVDARASSTPMLAQIACTKGLVNQDIDDLKKDSFILLFSLNSDKVTSNLFGEGTSSIYNFLPHIVSVSKIEESFRPFDQTLLEAGMPNSKAIAIFLEAIWLRASNIWFAECDSDIHRITVKYHLFQRAYWISRFISNKLAINIAEAYVFLHNPESVRFLSPAAFHTG